MPVRTADAQELEHLARLWHDGWQEAHAPLLPVELQQYRTVDSFRHRLQAALPNTRVVGPPGAPLGFCITKDDELYQLYVAAAARGSGVAAALIADAETGLAQRGVATAWLACAVGNDRAARFYEKCGWHRARLEVYHAETSDGTFPLEVWRYEKRLTAASTSGTP